MSALGTYLSQLRAERGLSIEEMARVTRVASRYLEALEREDFAALPAAVFTKGYIRAYCQALGVPVDEALSRYAESAGVVSAASTPAAAPASARSTDNGRRSRGTLLVSFVLLVGFGLALFVVALFLQSGRPEVGARRAEAPAETKALPATTPTPEALATPAMPAPMAPPPVVASPAASPPPTPPVFAPRPSDPKSEPSTEARPAPPTEARPETDPPRAAGTIGEPPPLRLRSVVSPYRLVARTVEPTWLRVKTEDGRATEETIPSGETREWISNRPFVVTIGNAAGIALELNGQKLPPLGGRGVVIMRMTLPPPEP
jgi:cytoskeleton protein RodZ